MDMSILNTCGLPERSILSVRSGPTRRQSPMPCTVPFRLPAGPWPLRIDVLALLGKSLSGASLAKQDKDGLCKIPLESEDGKKMSVTVQIYDMKAGGPRPKPVVPKLGGVKDLLSEPEAEDPPKPVPKRRDTEAEARQYLDQHRLHEFMHALFELLLRERPADPYTFIAAQFKQAADNELHGKVLDEHRRMPLPMPSLTNMPDSDARSAKTQKMSIVSSIPEPLPPPVPEGMIRFVVRNMRGRTHGRVVVAPHATISDVKGQVEASTGFTQASQQLLWWADTLPNDATVDELGLPERTEAVMHIVCNPRNPKLSMSLSASGDGSGLKLYDLRNGELLRTFGSTETSPGEIKQTPLIPLAMEVDWQNMRALIGCFDGRLQLWDLKDQKEGGRGLLKELEGHAEDINAMDVDWTSMRAITGSGDSGASSVRLWDLATGTKLGQFQAPCEVYQIAADWANNHVFAALRTGVLRVWRLDKGEHLLDIETGREQAQASGTSVASTSMDPLQHRALSGFEDGHLAYWHFSLSKDKPVTKSSGRMLGHYSAIRTMAVKWSEKDSRALCGSDDGSLSLWRLDSQECTARFGRHVGFVWSVTVDWEMNRALSGAFDGCVKLWDLRTAECLRTLQAHSRPVRSVVCGCPQ